MPSCLAGVVTKKPDQINRTIFAEICGPWEELESRIRFSKRSIQMCLNAPLPAGPAPISSLVRPGHCPGWRCATFPVCPCRAGTYLLDLLFEDANFCAKHNNKHARCQTVKSM
uniref:(northern house mosquito) hypothetical protein n=1 Tax=Culex pipiens TaxID=7175 RepID=A0A8D8DZD0_CULPI